MVQACWPPIPGLGTSEHVKISEPQFLKSVKWVDKGSYLEEHEMDNVPRGSEAYIFLGNIDIILPPLP